MKVLFTASTYTGRGGIETYTHQLCKHFAMSGNEVYLFILARADYLIQGGAEYDTIVSSAESSPGSFFGKLDQKLSLLVELRNVIRMKRIDCIICVEWDPFGYLLAVLSKLYKTQYFLSAHGQEIVNLSGSSLTRFAKAMLRRFAFANSNLVFAVSNFTRQRIIDIGIPTDRVVVLPNGVEIDEMYGRASAEGCTDTAKTRLGVGGRLVLLTVSRLVERKGHDKVIVTLPRLIEEFPTLIYIIVGTGPQEEYLRGLVQRSGLEPHVTFVGEVSDEDLPMYYLASDVFVMPCRTSRDGRDFEGFGIAYIESYKYGKPVVGGRSGGVEDAVEDGKTGFLVDPRDAAEIHERTSTLLRDPVLRQQMGEEGRNRVCHTYNWSHIAARMRECMNQYSAGSL